MTNVRGQHAQPRASRRPSRAVVRGVTFLAGILLAAAVAAQTSTATIRGKVADAQGKMLGGTQITAVNTASGFVKEVTAGADGSFQLAGLQPGEYVIALIASGYQQQNETLNVLVGQNLNVKFVMTPEKVINEEITVVGEQPVDIRTPEASTNVTTQQIETLPQDDRNFLNFAALAPGIRISTDPTRKVIASDAQQAESTNVYIDGVSYKNDVLQGGIVGQDTSRGNPFPQNAVQEFRVITQNYSAQYAKASSAIITAVTKSGGNEVSGQAFWFYQPKQWVSELPKNFQFNTLTGNSDYERDQPGISIGGPIVKDKLHYFFSYERVKEDATNTVNVQNPAFADQFAPFIGGFASPFTSNLGFGKLSWQPVSNQLLDLSGTYRKEDEVRDFGGTTSFQAANRVENWVYDATLRHQWNSNEALNQSSLSWQEYSWNQLPQGGDIPGQDFEGVIRIGGSVSHQEFVQKRLELKDDYNFAPIRTASMGEHALQVGGNVDSMKYDIERFQFGNPLFHFRNDAANGYSFAAPYAAEIGFGNPNLHLTNTEYGIYAQDTWTVTPRLTVIAGLRWDYETHMLDESYVTPAPIVAGLQGVIPSSYFSTGHQRGADKNEWQPRLGISYDVRGDGRSVVFGGAGRYYDRLFLNSTIEERYRQQFPVYRIEFAAPGQPGLQFDPSLLSREGLLNLIAQGQTHPEIYLLNNDTKTPYSDQLDLGYRQALGSWVGSISYNYVRSHHQFTWLSASGICCSALVPGFGNVIISDPQGKDTWYRGLFLTFDRPFANDWSAHVAWTHAKAEQNGNDLFSLDYPSAAAYPRHEVPGSERDHIVMAGIFGIPWDVKLGTTITLGTGGAFNVLDFSQGFDLPARERTHPFERSIRPPTTWGFADRSVDFSLEKDFPIGNMSIALVGQIFNAFNWATYGCLDNFIPPEGNPNFGNPSCVTNLGRREQVGLKINF